MASLVKYGMLSTTTNSMSGHLVKAQCDLCGRKYGSLEEARKCEREHFAREIRIVLQKKAGE